MRASNWFAGALSVVLCAAGALFAEESSGQQAIPERIKIQEARLGRIEEAAARETEQVEQWYTQRRAEMMRIVARPVAAEMSYADRIRWVEFMKMQRGLPYPAAYFDAAGYGFVIDPSAQLLRQAMEQEYFVAEMADLLVSEDFSDKLTQIVEERLDVPLRPVLREEARRLLDVVAPVRRELAAPLRHLENTRKARLDATMEWERNLKEQVRGILDYLRQRESREPQLGVVESIGYSPRTGYFAMVEGVDRVLERGDQVGEVRVLSINREKVEFAREGTTWTQQLGAPPEPHWR